MSTITDSQKSKARLAFMETLDDPKGEYLTALKSNSKTSQMLLYEIAEQLATKYNVYPDMLLTCVLSNPARVSRQREFHN